MTIVLLAAQVVLLLLLFPRIVLLALIVSAAVVRRLRGEGPDPPPSSDGPTRFVVLVPAHDEEGVVSVTVRSCQTVDYDPDRYQVVVIADNCTDGTASEAREAGATVIERSTPDRRSKGHALEDVFNGLGRDAIRSVDAFVIVDADSTVDRKILHEFDASLRRGDDFIQGNYTVLNADASWRTRLMTYAFALTNGVWLLGLDGLGLGVGLKGNGMCFRASALRQHPWRATGLVEDMEFAWLLRLAGERIRFRPKAQVFAQMPTQGGSGAASQRRRWESGRRALGQTFRRQLWRSDRLSWGQRLLYAIELDFPPLSRLFVMLLAATVLVLAGWPFGVSRAAFGIGAALATLSWMWFFCYIVAPFALLGLPLRFTLALLHGPYYIAWKATVGRRGRPDRWVRTPREVARPG